MNEETPQPAEFQPAPAPQPVPAQASVPTPAAIPTPAPASILPEGLPQRLDVAFVPYDRLSGWIGVVFVFGIGFLGLLALWVFSEAKPWKLAIATGAWLALVLLLVATTVFLPRKRWEHARWTISRAGLEIKKGVFFRSITNVPRSRVQHTDVTQGPIQRRFGLATLVVHTAGQQNSEVQLEGVTFDVAKALRDDLMAAGAGDGA